MAVDEPFFWPIWESPYDDAPRLVYADWLEESGDEIKVARADLIRVQCELAKLGEWDPRAAALEARETTLLHQFRRAWFPQRRTQARRSLTRFVRGFPEPAVSWPPNRLAKFLTKRYWVAPLWTYVQSHLPDDTWKELATCPHLDRITSWEIMWGDQAYSVEGRAVENWLPHLIEIFASPHLTHLRSFEWRDHPLSIQLLSSLSQCASLQRVRELILRGNHYEEEALRLLGTAFPQVERLDLANRDLGDDGVELLLSNGWSNLRSLTLSRNRMGNAGATIIAQCPALSNLVDLRLDNNNLGIGGLRAILNSPYLDSLRNLDVSFNNYSAESIRSILDTRRIGQLCRVMLTPSRYTEANAIESLLREPLGDRLRITHSYGGEEIPF